MQLDEAVVILSRLDSPTRQATLRDFPNLVSQSFLDHIDNEIERVTRSDGWVWPGVPEMVTGVFQDSLEVWSERLAAVRSDLFVVADQLANSTAGRPSYGTDSRQRAGTPVAHPPQGTAAQTSAPATGPTEQEIVNDFVEWDRTQYENQLEDRDYDRLRDDEVAYDSYQSYDSYSYDHE